MAASLVGCQPRGAPSPRRGAAGGSWRWATGRGSGRSGAAPHLAWGAASSTAGARSWGYCGDRMQTARTVTWSSQCFLVHMVHDETGYRIARQRRSCRPAQTAVNERRSSNIAINRSVRQQKDQGVVKLCSTAGL